MREEEDDVKTIIRSSERQIMRLTSTTDQFTVQLPFLITFLIWCDCVVSLVVSPTVYLLFRKNTT